MVAPPHHPRLWAVPSAERALVIEADYSLRHWLAAQLRDNGYAVIEAESAIGAADLARDLAPAVILLDLDLPYRSGLSLLWQLRAEAQTAQVPVVGLSVAPASLPSHRRPLASALVPKPCRADALRTALDLARTPCDSASEGAEGAEGAGRRDLWPDDCARQEITRAVPAISESLFHDARYLRDRVKFTIAGARAARARAQARPSGDLARVVRATRPLRLRTTRTGKDASD